MKPLSPKTDEVRQAMLDCLGGHPLPPSCALLGLRIRCAGDLQNLWHARGELMRALALMRGEAWAADQLARITLLFEPSLPQGLARSLHRNHARA